MNPLLPIQNRFCQSLKAIIAVAKSALPIATLFLVLISLALWQVISQLNTGLLGRESSLSLWSFWWLQQATQWNFDPMVTSYAMFPFQQNLLLNLSPLYSLMYQVLTGLGIAVPLSFNLLAVLSILFTGGATLVFLRSLQVPKGLALLWALLLAFSPIMYYKLAQGRPDLMALGWIPLSCWVWDRICRDRIRNGFRLGFAITLVGAILTSIQVAIATIIVCSFYIVMRLWQTKPTDRLHLLNHLLLQLLVLLAVTMVYPLPGLLKTLWGLAPATKAVALSGADWQISFGMLLLAGVWLVLIGSAASLKGDRTRWLWAGIGLTALLLALVTGSTWEPRWRSFLSADDWLGIALTSFAFFSALSLAPYWQFNDNNRSSRLQFGSKVLPLSLLTLALLTLPPIPTVPWQPTRVYADLGQESADYTLLEIPVGIRAINRNRQFGSGDFLQQYVAIHHKQTMNGATLGRAEDAFAFYEASPLFNYLAGKTNQPTEAIVQELATTIKQKRIGYVVVHSQLLTDSQQSSIPIFLEGQTTILCKVMNDSGGIVYRTSWHPIGCGKNS